MAGHPVAYIWISVGLCGAVCPCDHELDVVWQNPQGLEEDTDEKGMNL